MPKVTSNAVALVKSLFEVGDVLTEENFAELIDLIANAAEAHEHTAFGGDGSGTGDAAPIGATAYAGPITVGVTAVAPAVFVGG